MYAIAQSQWWLIYSDAIEKQPACACTHADRREAKTRLDEDLPVPVVWQTGTADRNEGVPLPWEVNSYNDPYTTIFVFDR